MKCVLQHQNCTSTQKMDDQKWSLNGTFQFFKITFRTGPVGIFSEKLNPLNANFQGLDNSKSGLSESAFHRWWE